MRIAFLGFGLIAGSIARALRDAPGPADWSVAAWSPSGQGPSQGSGEGTVDLAAATPAAAIEGADLIMLAAPVPACLALLDELAGGLSGVLPAGAVVTDVASTKAGLVERANTLGIRYVGGHPMAGLESTGYAAGRADLFVGRPWAIVPGRMADAVDIERVERLVRACGAQAVTIDAVVHDRAVAGISHLPLLLAAALTEAVAGAAPGPAREDWAIAATLAAGGWRDMTRLARGDPHMGAGIMATNAAAVVSRIKDLQAVLTEWAAELERTAGPDAVAIEERLRTARARLDAS